MIVKILNKSGLELPRYATKNSACVDLMSNQEIELKKGQTALIGTGIHVEIPDGWCLLIFARSSLHKKGLYLANGVGVIDSDYRGEVMIPIYCDRYACSISRGQRLAQAMLQKIEKIVWKEVDQLDDTERSIGGFGSTGE